MGLKGINFKNFFIVFALSIVLNLFLSGPEAFKKRLISFYEKPELTVYPLKCVLGQFFIMSMEFDKTISD